MGTFSFIKYTKKGHLFAWTIDEEASRFSYAAILEGYFLIPGGKSKSFTADLSNNHTQNQTSFERVSIIIM